MPKMKDKLGSVDVRQMVAFVRAFREGKQVVDDEPEEPPAAVPPSDAVTTNNARPGSVQPRQSDPEGARVSGKRARTFQRSCAACHGTDGRGSEMRDTLPAIPDFTAHAWQDDHSNPQLVVSVLDGKGTGMPPFRDKLTRDQVRDLVAFIRSFDPSPTTAGTSVHG